MRAVTYESFGGPVTVEQLPDPVPGPADAVIAVESTGLCRSDWHGWMGHDDDISTFPHVPGHELAGVVREVGADVRRWRPGDRVTVPFISACGSCPSCQAGDQQVCSAQTQPGFTHWGSYAEAVRIHQADVNLVALPETMAYDTAAALGCRFATSFRAVRDIGGARAGEWVAVHGCGGVGLSAVMIAAAAGAQVIAIDLNDEALSLATELGAAAVLNGTGVDTAEAVRTLTGGGAHLSLDALGHPATAANSINGLRRRGRHVQVGLLPGAATALPMGRVIAHELALLGSHGMAAHAYPEMMALVSSGKLRPDRLITRTIGLAGAAAALPEMHRSTAAGMTMISPADL
ncbi:MULTISPECIES: zinc-dependent alcohol dehydrogenase family protein [unclassified Crossiella]|uniref:zinc-dependent alcohol dehydrogenase family protein n=1 Tax=unclassified Crossiella TaxID=2620835 RepID=UPI001FFEA35A|nr:MULTISPECIES: zinc-dependent alcohol dehydrogenase family protein [unclassified Crossiella]MCK2236301.1 zinc-dependent alcohol dehydrogenase family protein [Crossiella sp. S99.2]MCK2249968.1 zinc-dependent alcohol dehydrogenase family protein [Crossiella sp. S99.1]